jgi:hypothetical protein
MAKQALIGHSDDPALVILWTDMAVPYAGG